MTTRKLAAPADALEGDLGWTLGVVFRSYVDRAHEALEDLPGGPRGYQVLAAAADDETPSGQGALARRLGLDKTVMTYLVDDLVDAGLLTREPDPADRRHRLLVATARGRRTLRSRRQRLDDVEKAVLLPLGQRERGQLRELLQHLAQHAQPDARTADLCAAAEALEG